MGGIQKLNDAIEKASEVLEVHYEDKELRRYEVSDLVIKTTSVEAIARDFKKITTVSDVDLYLQTKQFKYGLPLFRGYTQKIEYDGRRKFVFLLAFKHRPNFDPNKFGTKRLFQVDLVETSPEVTRLGLATYIYKYLVSQNSTILSDNHQYRGGKAIWKKLCKDSDFKVRVFHQENNDFLRDDKGKVIVYDGSNIPEEQIWDDKWDSEVSKNIVLVLNKR